MKKYENTVLKIDALAQKKRKIVHVRFSHTLNDENVCKSHIKPYRSDFYPEDLRELKFF